MTSSSDNDDPFHIIAINRTQRYSLLANGQQVEWDELFDSDGEETDDMDQAASATCMLPNGEWVTLDLTCWEVVTIH